MKRTSQQDPTTLIEVLERHLARQADRVQVTVGHSEHTDTLTYAELHHRGLSVASALQQQGIGAGETVALMLPTSTAYFSAFLGVLLAGAIPVPIYPPFRKTQLTEHVLRLRSILMNASAAALITAAEVHIIARLLHAQVPSVRTVLNPEMLLGRRGNVRPVPLNARSTAMLQYTSGSTGAPKGVVLSHANVLANIRAMGRAADVTDADVFVSWLPLYHDMGLIGAWLGTLYFGCSLVVMQPSAFLAHPAQWLWTIHRVGGTISAAPNFGYELCTRRIEEREIEGLDLSSWRIAFNGSEPVRPGTLERFTGRFGAYGFDARAMTPVYGLAESTLGITFPPLGREPAIDVVDAEQLADEGRATPATGTTRRKVRLVSCGSPLAGHQVRTVDANGAELGERVEGVLQFAGPSVTSGYFDNEAATRELVRGEWRDSGDRAYLADGELYITGRVKDTIIRRGRKIHAEDWEETIGDIPGIRRGCVAVFGAVDRQTGSERVVVVAETRERDAEALEQLRHGVIRALVERHGEPPDEIVLAPPGTVLKTSSGKLRRSATRAAFESGTLGRRSPAPAWQLVQLVAAAIGPGLRRMLNARRT